MYITNVVQQQCDNQRRYKQINYNNSNRREQVAVAGLRTYPRLTIDFMLSKTQLLTHALDAINF